jgi:NAD(P)-dependent dehydrogenase (short-subunit alcohol dehydrogenase family)
MGAYFQSQHSRDVLSHQGSRAAHAAWQRHHQYLLDQLDIPNPTLLAYATTKGAIQNFTAGLAQLLAEKGIRANTVAPGPIWTPLIPSTMPEDAVAKFGKQVPMQRPGQPAERATTYVMLADPLSSYVSGATIASRLRHRITAAGLLAFGVYGIAEGPYRRIR